jgi:hypothetical protein
MYKNNIYNGVGIIMNILKVLFKNFLIPYYVLYYSITFQRFSQHPSMKMTRSVLYIQIPLSLITVMYVIDALVI